MNSVFEVVATMEGLLVAYSAFHLKLPTFAIFHVLDSKWSNSKLDRHIAFLYSVNFY